MTDLETVLESRNKPQAAKRVKKPKKYSDLVWNSMAHVGDVVYMPSNPDVKMTVAKLPYINHAAHSFGRQYEVSVQWLDANGHMTSATVYADTLLRD